MKRIIAGDPAGKSTVSVLHETLLLKDRSDAGTRLARLLMAFRGKRPLVLGTPCGGVAVARAVADQLDGDLDVVLAQALCAPAHGELVIGAVDEQGHVVMADDVGPEAVSDAYVEQEAARQFQLIRQHRRLYCPHRAASDPRGRLVIVVDDGATPRAALAAALKVVRKRRPARLVCAVPVLSPLDLEAIRREADDVVCLASPASFESIGPFFEHFDPVVDEEVISLLSQRPGPEDGGGSQQRCAQFVVDDVTLDGDLQVPPYPRGIVVFAHGAGSSRKSERNRFVASVLQRRGFATLLFDLLDAPGDSAASRRTDIAIQARRLDAVLDGLARDMSIKALPIGLFGAGTGAAAALIVAADRTDVRAVVARGGRPDLVDRDRLSRLTSPTLLIVAGLNEEVAACNRLALSAMSTHVELVSIPGATHLFKESGALERVATLASEWFIRWL